LWRSRALCLGLRSAVAFPDRADGFTSGMAAAVCRRCEVRSPCLDFALEIGASEGIFGGPPPHTAAEAAAVRLNPRIALGRELVGEVPTTSLIRATQKPSTKFRKGSLTREKCLQTPRRYTALEALVMRRSGVRFPVRLALTRGFTDSTYPAQEIW
jgi:WhiB family redox-sensing transcriptional regulator